MDIGSKAGTRNVEFWASGGYICGCGRPNSLVVFGTLTSTNIFLDGMWSTFRTQCKFSVDIFKLLCMYVSADL